MRKEKVIAIITLLLFVAGGAFAKNKFSISAGGGGDVSYDLETDTMVFGFNGFVDFTYLLLSAGVNIIKKDVGFSAAANLKFPFNLTDSLSIFPTAGAEYRRFNKVNSFLLNAGVGVDFSIGANVFARLCALYVFSPKDFKNGKLTLRPSVGFRF